MQRVLAGKAHGAERSVREALEKERELHGLKSRFVAMASHDLRNMLSGLSMSAASLADIRCDDPARAAHHDLDGAEQGLAALAEELRAERQRDIRALAAGLREVQVSYQKQIGSGEWEQSSFPEPKAGLSAVEFRARCAGSRRPCSTPSNTPG